MPTQLVTGEVDGLQYLPFNLSRTNLLSFTKNFQVHSLPKPCLVTDLSLEYCFFFRYLAGGGVIEGQLKNVDIRSYLESLNGVDDSREVAALKSQVKRMKKAQKIISGGINERNLRKAQVAVIKEKRRLGKRVSSYIVGDKKSASHAFQTCPPQKINYLLSDCLDFLNNENIHALRRVIVGTHQFPMIHPFNDGNGRLWRSIVICLLSKHYHKVFVFLIVFYMKIISPTELYQSLLCVRRGSEKEYLKFWNSCLVWATQFFSWYEENVKNECKSNQIFSLVEFDYMLKASKRDNA